MYRQRCVTLLELFVGLVIVFLAIILILASCGGCSVSHGVRRGEITKFSIRGIYWKTHEGQMLLGGVRDGAANTWEFSVFRTNPDANDLAQKLEEARDSGEQVLLEYEQHFFVWPWRASTGYDIVDVRPPSAAKKEDDEEPSSTRTKKKR